MRVAAFYSPLRGIGHVDAWHDHSDCPIGQSIALADRLAGVSHCPRCTYCALLDQLPSSGPGRRRRRLGGGGQADAEGTQQR
jgi:hypothetical protein